MEPHLYLIRGKKNILLVRYFDMLHFVTLDHRMSYKVRPWFLEKPRSEQEMDQKGIVRTSIDLKDIRGVGAGGTGRGCVVQFYLKEGKKRYELKEDCSLSDMSALFDGLESFVPPKKESKWQDPRLAKQNPALRKILWPVSFVMDAVSVICAFIMLSEGFENPWICWLSLLCIPVSLTLYCLYPDYFMLFRLRRRHGQKKGVRELWAPAVSAAFMLLSALRHYRIFAWWKAWIIGGVIVIAIAFVLHRIVPAFWDGNMLAGFLVVGLFLCGAPVLMLNNVLDSNPVREVRVEVEEKDTDKTRRGRRRYEFTVTVDGKEIDIPVDGATYEDTEIGEYVTIELHEGAFGIGYAKIG